MEDLYLMQRASQQETPRGAMIQKETVVSRILKRLLYVSLFMVFLGTPLFFTSLTLQGMNFERGMFLAIFVLLSFSFWVVIGIHEGKLRIMRRPIDIMLLIFWAAYAISVIFSVDRWHSFIGPFTDPSRGLLIVTALVMVYFILASTQTERLLKSIFGALAIGFGIHAIWSAFMLYGGVGLLSERALRFIPVYLAGSPSSQAILSTVGLLVIASGTLALFSVRNIFLRYVLIFLAVVALFSEIATIAALYLLIPWLALLIGAGFFSAYLMGNIVLAPRGWQWVGSGLFFVVALLLILGPSILARVPSEGAGQHYIQDSWDIVKSSASHAPVIGNGPGMYSHVFSKFYPSTWNLSPNFIVRFSQSPDAFLGMMVSSGAVGTLAFSLLFAMAIGIALHALPQERNKKNVLFLGACSGAIAFLIATMMLAVNGTVLISGILLCILAMSFAMYESGADDRSTMISLRAKPQYAIASSFSFMVAGAGAAFLFVFIVKMFSADFYAGAAVRTDSDTGYDRKMDLFNKSIELNSREGWYFLYAGSSAFSKAYALLLDPKESLDRDTVQQQIRVSLGLLTLGRNLLPDDVSAQTLLAGAYETVAPYAEDGPMAGRDSYLRASELEPNNPSYQVKIAEFALFQAGKEKEKSEAQKKLLDEAESRLKKSLDLHIANASAYYDLGQVYEMRGDFDQSIASFESAVSIGRDVPSALALARAYRLRGKDDDLKKAENVLTQIIGVNDHEVNAHLELANLYEKDGRIADALSEYEKARDILPEESKSARDQINGFITELRNKGNVTVREDSSLKSPEGAGNGQPQSLNEAGNPVSGR